MNMNINLFESLSVPGFILFFIILWVLVCKLISAAAGWRLLARDYQANTGFEGRKLWLKSAGMRRWASYNNCLTVGVDKYGLYLAVLPIFRIGHPPLFFPWTDISTEAGSRRLLGEFIRFTFAKQPDVPVIFSKRLATRIFQMKAEYKPQAGS